MIYSVAGSSSAKEQASNKDTPGAKRLSDFLKLLANSTSYGIFGEMNRRDLPPSNTESVNVFALDQTVREVGSPEDPGAWCFPPLGAFITGGARSDCQTARENGRVARVGTL